MVAALTTRHRTNFRPAEKFDFFHTRRTGFASLLQSELKAMVLVLPSAFKPVLQQIGLVKVAKSCCRKWTVVLLFATNSVHVVHFTGPRQTCFAATDVSLLFGVTALFYPIRSLL